MKMLCSGLFRRMSTLILAASFSALLGAQGVTCWFAPDDDKTQIDTIATSLSKESHIAIHARKAFSYPEMVKAFEAGGPSLAFVGSFAAAMLISQDKAVPLIQKINGSELYAGIMIYPRGRDPQQILRDTPQMIAFAEGSTAGEASALAATNGKASIKVRSNLAAAIAVKTGEAKAAFVKDTWWSSASADFDGMASCLIPGISEKKNPDFVLLASKDIAPEMQAKIKEAANESKEAFGAAEMKDVGPGLLDFTLDLMRRANIDPSSYKFR